MAEEYRVTALSWEDVLADPGVAGVAIATPAAHHAWLAGAALAAGKDVFVEKPLSIELSDAEALVNQARKLGRILMVGHLLQYHPAFRALKSIIVDGSLGRLRYIYSNRLNFGKVRQEENVLWSLAPHDLSMILSLASALPTRVSAEAFTYLSPGIPDFATLHMGFPGNLNAQVNVSWLNPFKEQKLVVVGTEAMAVFDDCRGWEEKLRLYRHSIVEDRGLPTTKVAEGEFIPVSEGEPLRLECQQFLTSTATRQAPPTDGVEGLRVLRVLSMAQDRLDSGQ